jgi:hypothetical protein
MIPYIVVFIIAFVIGFFIGVLFAKRNPAIVEKVNEAYLKGKKEAEEELKEKLAQAEKLIRSKTGSIEIPQINISAAKKYLLRFVPPLAALMLLIALLRPGNIEVVLYKLCLVLIAMILAESVWILFFKSVFGKVEETRSYDKRSILIFRGALYAAIILAVCLGL